MSLGGIYMKKFTSKILTLCLLFSLSLSVFNAGLITSATETSSTSQKINSLNNKIINYLDTINPQDATPENIEYFLKNNISDEEKLTGIEYAELANKSNNKAKELTKKGYTTNEIAEAQIIDSVITKNNLKVEFLDNGLFSIKNLNDSITPSSRSNSVWGQAYKDYYSNIGVHIFTIAVGTGFSYNGQKASYYGNFTAYYKRGNLSIWQVDNWEKGHEPVGSSYQAFAQGNFHYGLEVSGVGIVFQDLYISHSVTCSKDGKISKNFRVI